MREVPPWHDEEIAKVKYKNCPFCGGDELCIGRGEEDREGYPVYVYCDECGCHGPWIYTRNQSILSSIWRACEETGWNKRV